MLAQEGSLAADRSTNDCLFSRALSKRFERAHTLSDIKTAETQHNISPTSARKKYRWRVVDIIVMAVLAILTGAIFAGWNIGGVAWMTFMNSITPGLGGLALGGWLIGGVLGGLIIGKPGAALLVELLAAFTEVIFGA